MTNFEKYSKENIYFFSTDLPELLTEIIRKKQPSSLVDIGCGDGDLFFSLIKEGLSKKIKKLIGVDLSPERLCRVKKYFPKVSTVLSNACDLTKLKNCKFDLVVSQQVIEHVKDDNQMLQEIKKTLHTDGYLFISSVIKKWYGWWIYKYNGKVRCDPTHIREYNSKEEFVNLLKRNGFKILKTKLRPFRPSIINGVVRYLVKKGMLSEDKARQFIKKARLKIIVPGYYIVEVIAVLKNE